MIAALDAWFDRVVGGIRIGLRLAPQSHNLPANLAAKMLSGDYGAIITIIELPH